MSPNIGVIEGSLMFSFEKLLVGAPNVLENSESRLLLDDAWGICCWVCCSCLTTGTGPPKMSRSASWFDLRGLVGPVWLSVTGEEKLRP